MLLLSPGAQARRRSGKPAMVLTRRRVMTLLGEFGAVMHVVY
jgi:hypothetical protein